MSGDTLGLVLRLVLSLAAVVGLMWLAARVLRSSVTGGSTGVLDVVARQQLGRGTSVAVVRVAGQALVVGVTETRVTLIAEADLAAIEEVQAAADTSRTEVRATLDPATAEVGALRGSIVSPATWKQAVNVLRDRTARKG